METVTYIIQDTLGIHARPAGLIVKKAREFESGITLRIGDKAANANKLFEVMGLGAKQGDTLLIELTGADETVAANVFADFLRETL